MPQPRYILRVEAFAERPATKTDSGRLLMAIMEMALHDFDKYLGVRHPTARLLFDDAWRWLSDTDNYHHTSCANACEVLRINQQALVTELRRRIRLVTHKAA